MSLKLYHKDIYFRPMFNTLCSEMLESRPISTTYHYNSRCSQKHIDTTKVAIIVELMQDRCKNYEIFEVKNGDKYIEEFAIRTPYDRENDLCIVFANSYDRASRTPYLTIKTVWLNNLNDSHKTLDESKYEKN